MIDLEKEYSLTLRNGLYYTRKGLPYKSPSGCNSIRGKLQKIGYKVTVCKVDNGYALRVMPPTPSVVDRQATNEGVPQKPQTGNRETEQDATVQELARQVAELQAKLSEKDGVVVESATTRGNAPSRRPKRKPFRRNRLEFPQRPGYRRRVVNDVEDGMRVAAFKEAGWEVVSDPYAGVNSDGDLSQPSQEGSAVSRHVGMGEGGRSLKGILMEIPEEWYQEDQAAKQERVDNTEKGLRVVNKDGVTGGLTTSGFEAEVNKRI